MRISHTLIATVKETPADAEIVSHRLMLRAGLIRPLAAGLYTWLPLGMRVLRKVESIVREEMDASGALEVFMPAIQPAELWKESGRWEKYGPELLRIRDRHERDFCFGPTHEEVITDLARREIRSYRQLPVNLYQIQTKFRDEVRPRFGVMRSREFVMKDAYSFDLGHEAHQSSYRAMHDAYCRIFERTGLDFRVVAADSGAIGGSRSHEFHVLADSGEDAIAFSSGSAFAANVELVPCRPPAEPRAAPAEDLEAVHTPGVRSIPELAKCLGVPARRCLETLFLEGEDGSPIAVCLRGDHELNLIKAAGMPGVATPVAFSSPERVEAATGCPPGSIGPVGLSLPMYADHAALRMSDFICGANREDRHLRGVNWGRDRDEPEAADLRNAVEGDPSPDDSGPLSVARGIEVGHIFQLGEEYSRSMGSVVQDERGRAVNLFMGCYGIGVTRVVAAAIEQNHDERGIIWPAAIAPYHVVLLPMNMHKSERLRAAVDRVYDALRGAGIEVLLDDRRVRPGVMFADSELMGIPYRVVMSDRGLDGGHAECRHRREEVSTEVPLDAIAGTLRARIDAETGAARAREAARS